ncbi:hypothetical protein E0Z10_g2189 [Xylaria hypoxylon]|uniref:Uncharacterized protein n=1 Tax=Xylaria hypoxylon TaxID=37992 RepID=A0A4Z0Z4Z7_9PEZI|nr:hypothetical protein E0Z10_g2189 [Xylaria hypoxylon]
MEPPRLMELWQPAFDSGSIEWAGGAILLLRSFYRVDVLDWYWRGLTVTFAPATLGFDPLGWWTGFQFLTQLGPLYATWMLEDARQAVDGSVPGAALFMFLGQIFGTGVIVPIYYFLTFVSGSTAADLARLAPNREEIQGRLWFRFTPFFLPLLLSIHLAPVAGAFLASRLETRHICVWLWFLVPVCLGLGDAILTSFFLLGQTPKPNYRATLVVERHLSVLMSLCAGIWMYMLACAPYPLSTIFVPNGRNHDDLVLHSRLVWQSDFLCTFGSAALFLAYQCIDLYRAGLLEINDWLLAASLPVVTASGGPGTAVAAAWLWKERVMQRILSSEVKIPM